MPKSLVFRPPWQSAVVVRVVSYIEQTRELPKDTNMLSHQGARIQRKVGDRRVARWIYEANKNGEAESLRYWGGD